MVGSLYAEEVLLTDHQTLSLIIGRDSMSQVVRPNSSTQSSASDSPLADSCTVQHRLFVRFEAKYRIKCRCHLMAIYRSLLVSNRPTDGVNVMDS